jgi:hypothetical protein
VAAPKAPTLWDDEDEDEDDAVEEDGSEGEDEGGGRSRGGRGGASLLRPGGGGGGRGSGRGGGERGGGDRSDGGKRDGKRVPFTTAEVVYLKEGVVKFKSSKQMWRDILSNYKFHERRTAVDLKDKYRNLCKNA